VSMNTNDLITKEEAFLVIVDELVDASSHLYHAIAYPVLDGDDTARVDHAMARVASAIARIRPGRSAHASL